MKAYSTLFIVFMLCFSTWAQDKDYSFKEEYKVSTPAELVLSTSDGNVEVVSSAGEVIQVYYIVRKSGKLLSINRKKLEEEMIVEVVHDRNKLEITVRNKDNWSWSLNNWNQINVGFKVMVPKETSCTIHTSDGNVSLRGVRGNQRCKTSDGNISIAEVQGEVSGGTSDGNVQLNAIVGAITMKTSDGNIDIEEVKGNIEASTSDGNIRISDVQGDASFRTSDGDVYFTNVSGALSATTSDGSIRGTMKRLGNELTLKTSDGNIDVTIPENTGLDLNVKGESLQVPLFNFSGESDKHSIKGKSNGGGVPVNLLTSDGNVRLTYR